MTSYALYPPARIFKVDVALWITIIKICAVADIQGVFLSRTFTGENSVSKTIQGY